MKKLLMLLIVLALSLPAYAQTQDILVYKTTMTGPRLAEDGVKTAKVRGYLVLECDATEISNLENGQAVPTGGRHILYVKDGRKKWRSTEPQDGTMYYFKPGKKKGTMFLRHWYDYDLGTHEGVMRSEVYGRVRRTLIGTGKPKPRIPTKLKGNVEVTDDWFGACRLTIKLDSKRTKNANKEDKTVDQVVQALQNRLERKGYDPSPQP
jgi:hypothetical protein